MSYVIGKRSADNLKGVHPDLVKVFRRALEISFATKGPDFGCICGVRTPAEQKALYAQGRTVLRDAKGNKLNKVTWTLISNHFVNKKTGFGHAVDLFPGAWSPNSLFDHMARCMFQAAKELKVPIRWGADWDRDGNPRERGETDSPHFELVI